MTPTNQVRFSAMRPSAMTNDPKLSETRAFWNRIAEGWEVQVGDSGDSNRRMNSDPVLWDLVGDVTGLDVLDAGCGTGYLTRILEERGANPIGIDLSESMLEIARHKSSHLSFRHDSCTELATVNSDSIDVLVSNYVLMDCPDLDAAVESFYRVLRAGGFTVLVFSHPCFPQGKASDGSHDAEVSYRWDESYFTEGQQADPPWGHFTDQFIWFHRPLSTYWKAFQSAGFSVERFEEPRVTAERYHLAENERALKRSQSRPYSVAFKLRKSS